MGVIKIPALKNAIKQVTVIQNNIKKSLTGYSTVGSSGCATCKSIK